VKFVRLFGDSGERGSLIGPDSFFWRIFFSCLPVKTAPFLYKTFADGSFLRATLLSLSFAAKWFFLSNFRDADSHLMPKDVLRDESSQFHALCFNLFSDLGRQAILKVVDRIKRCQGVLPAHFMVPEIANL
jgi:hypothetical protein